MTTKVNEDYEQQVKQIIIIHLHGENSNSKQKSEKVKLKGFDDVLHVKVCDEEYSILITSIFDGIDNVCQAKLNAAQQQRQILANLQNQNIIKYINEFQIGMSYCLQVEKYEQSLQDWINSNQSNKIDRSLFIRIALEILNAIQYLHSQNYVLRDLSPQSILLNKELKIKIYSYGQPHYINPALIVSDFKKESNSQNEMNYIPPELLETNCIEQEQNNKQIRILSDQKGDIWNLGICLYVLAGARFEHIRQFTLGLEQYQMQPLVDMEINLIIQNILQRNPIERPSIQTIQQQFQNLNILDEAFQCYENKDFNRAVNFLEQSIETNPNSAIAQTKLGCSYSQLNNQDKSIFWFNKAIETDPNYSKAYFHLGEILEKQQKFTESIYCFNKVTEQEILNVDAYLRLGLLYFKEKMNVDAIKYLQKAISIDKDNLKANMTLGFIYSEIDLLENSIFYYQKAVEIDPKNDDGYFLLGFSYKRKGMNDEAINCYKQAIKINPKDSLSYYYMGVIYNKQSTLNESIICNKKASKIDSKYADAYNNLSQSYYRKDMNDCAIKYYKRCLSIDPSDLIFRNNMKNAKKYM